MKVKKYIAPSMPEAMQKIRKELGSNAVILNSKETKSRGIFGLFRKKNIEVVAGIDPNPLAEQENKKPKMSEKPMTMEETSTSSNAKVLNEIKQLKKMIEMQSNYHLESDEPEYKLALQYLIDQEVSDKLAEEMINSIIRTHQEKEVSVSMEKVMEDIAAYIENRLQPFHFTGFNKKKIIQFVGPTGVGKTTTLAKIAANLILKEHKKVAFITMDTYRIAAVDQLKTYARILSVPLEVVYSMEDYQHAITKFKEFDVILIDTAGRNFRDKKYVDDLKNSMDAILEIETYLVLALTAKPKDLSDIYDQFHSINIKAAIFTKMDETSQFGSLINIAFNKLIDIAFLTNGQDVPNDLLLATPKKISQLIVGEYNHE